MGHLRPPQSDSSLLHDRRPHQLKVIGRLEIARASQFGKPSETETFGVKSSLNDIISEAVLKSSLMPFQSSDAMTFRKKGS